MAASTPGRQRREAERLSEPFRTRKRAAAAVRLERLRESRESCSLVGGGFQVSLSQEGHPKLMSRVKVQDGAQQVEYLHVC